MSTFAQRMHNVATGIADGQQKERLSRLKSEWLAFIEGEANKGKTSTTAESFGRQDIRPNWDGLLKPLLEEEGLKIKYNAGDHREPHSVSYHTISW